ncbi:hypothetical protein C7G41_19450 [Bradyrhizobium sp. MOS002]|nr:hypothetical protein C7G41_19450 [Bradyrhizobium sp. MOS002]
MAICVFIDGNGIIRERSHPYEQLTPLWLSLSPKTTWPETSRFDVAAIEREEAEAKAARKAGKKIARKSRRSNKIKRVSR